MVARYVKTMIQCKILGLPNVFVNGMAHARIGDALACGSSNETGSGNVFING